jgi:hypothetical protein
VLSGDVMTVISKITIDEYGLDSESLQMTERECLRLDVSEIPLH